MGPTVSDGELLDKHRARPVAEQFAMSYNGLFAALLLEELLQARKINFVQNLKCRLIG